MSTLIFKNNAQSTITGTLDASAGAITVDVQIGTGALFASPTPGQTYFVATLVDAATGLENEIVHVTERVGDRLTIVRGQEGTAIQGWEPNDSIAELWTAGQCERMLQKGDEQSGASTFGVATGSGGHYVVALDPVLSVNTLGQTFRFKANHSNAGAAFINFGTGEVSLRNAQGLLLSGGEIIADYVYECYWNGATYNLAMPSLVTIPTGMIAPYAGGTVPTGWLACNGQAVSNALYPALFAVIGTVYGGTGLPNFNVPDLNGRLIAGIDSGGSTRLTGQITPNSGTIGGVGGAKEIILTAAQLAAHNHTATVNITDPGHFHSFDPTYQSNATGASTVLTPGQSYSGAINYHLNDKTLSKPTGITATATVAPTTGNTAHSNTQPTMVMLYMIKT